MTRTSHYMSVALFCACTAICSAQDQQRTPDSQVVAPQTPSNSKPADVKTDLERMQVLLGQMQRNVAFVSAGDTPLKHQFELEIQMWQLLIRDIEKNSQGDASR